MRTASLFLAFEALCLAYLAMATAAHAQGRMACPAMLVTGEFNQESVEVTVRNMGKLPIREFELNCASAQGNVVKRSACHTEEGIFYPGTPYSIDFGNSGKRSASMVVTLTMARLSDGSMWTSSHDQPCKPLKIYRKKS